MLVYRLSEAGISHRLMGLGNQDACAVHRSGEDVFVFMADGMGSARLGGQAARAAVDTAAALVPWTYLSDEHMRGAARMMAVKAAFPIAYNALVNAAHKNAWDTREMLTTFMCAAYNEVDRQLTFGFCGDGGIVALTYTGEVRLLTRAAKGAEKHQTTPLHCFDGWSFGTCENVRAFVMCTDGVFDKLCPNGSVPRDPRLRKLLKRLLKLPTRLGEEQLVLVLDNAFSSERPVLDDLGALMDDVTDDRSVVLVSGKVKRPEVPEVQVSVATGERAPGSVLSTTVSRAPINHPPRMPYAPSAPHVSGASIRRELVR